MIRRGFGWMLSLLTALQLPSCQFNVNVETLLSPPRLTEEQEQIYQALQAAAGQSVSLKYPKSGTRLSAFLVEDFDGDGADEAIVFYNSNRIVADENPLRLCLLDQKNGKWRAVTHYTTAGAEVERVDVEYLGENPKKNIIISYSMVDGAERTAEIFQYESGALRQTLSLPFSILTVADLNADGTQELFVAAAAKQPSPATAAVYSLAEDGSYPPPAQVSLPESFADVTRMSSGLLPEFEGPLPAIYLDGASGATTVQTAVLTYNEARLSLIYTDSADRPFSTARPSGWQAMDIDNDGEIEIPVQATFYGYQTEANTPGISMTGWDVCRGGQLMREYASYYAVQNNYVFIMPSRWERKVTAAMESEEVVFYEFDRNVNAADGTPVKKTELLRLAVVDDPVAADAMEQDGYLMLRKKYGNYYMAKRTVRNHSLSITDSELILAMRIL